MSGRRIADLGKDELRRAIALTIARSILLFSAVIYLYYVFPFGGGTMNSTAWIRLVLGIAFFGLTVFLVARKVWNAKHPQLGAVEALAVAFPRFICVYAGVYLGLSHQNPAAFSEVLTHTSSLYFTVVTFGTVGFGDIRPVTDLARLVVTSQILIDVLFIAFVVRGIFGISRLALSRESN
jgi:hypothetical protein